MRCVKEECVVCSHRPGPWNTLLHTRGSRQSEGWVVSSVLSLVWLCKRRTKWLRPLHCEILASVGAAPLGLRLRRFFRSTNSVCGGATARGAWASRKSRELS